jgi:hypothetical protein
LAIVEGVDGGAAILPASARTMAPEKREETRLVTWYTSKTGAYLINRTATRDMDQHKTELSFVFDI